MIQQETAAEKEQRLQEEKEQREFYLNDERAKEAHLRRLKKIEVSGKKATYRAEALVSVIKHLTLLPAIFVIALFVPVIILCGKEVPQFLQDMFE